MLPRLAARGLDVALWSWTWDDAPWEQAGLCVIRTTWGYEDGLDAYLAWVDRVAAATRLENPRELVHANTHKRYLRDLEAAGVPVVPTRWLAAGQAVDLAALLREAGWSRYVVKPAVDAGARGAMRGGPHDLARAQAWTDVLLGRGEVLVQPFLDAVVREGELSAVFFDGALSHGLRKRAGAGDWRVQEEWGGQPGREALCAEAVRLAQRALDVTGSGLYARVDLVPIPGGGLGVIEVELVEPALYLGCDPGAAERFAAAIAGRL